MKAVKNKPMISTGMSKNIDIFPDSIINTYSELIRYLTNDELGKLPDDSMAQDMDTTEKKNSTLSR